MKDHRMPFLGIGAASIVLVLTIVSLSVFATLTRKIGKKEGSTTKIPFFERNLYFFAEILV